jgi:[ribosomal protein S5]-alanine N-acetyltransferase
VYFTLQPGIIPLMFNTERLTIQKFTWDDFEAYAALMADPEVMRFSLKGPLTCEEAKRAFEERILKIYDTCGWGLWAVFLKNQLIGFAGLIPQEVDEAAEIELAFRFAPAYWGQGLAFEASEAILDYAFSFLKIPRLISIIDPKNTRSQKLSSRLGFHVEKQANYQGFNVDIYARSNTD